MERNRTQADLLKADIDRLRDDQVAALQDELRGMHQQYAARAAAVSADEDYAVLNGQINEQLEALSALLPTPRPPED